MVAASEALLLLARGKPLALYLGDYSAVVTAWLLAVALPLLAPWWLTVIGVLAAIVLAKHLYGGLGYNPFNPAMIGYVVLLISFPARGEQLAGATWSGSMAALDLLDSARAILAACCRLGYCSGRADRASTARCAAHAAGSGAERERVLLDPVFGLVAGHGWEWVALGLFSWRVVAGLHPCCRLAHSGRHDRRTGADRDGFIWPIRSTMCAALVSSVEWCGDFRRFLHLYRSGDRQHHAARSTAIRRRGIGVLVYVIRTFGGYPDGVAFAVLLMNIAPTIDLYTQPRVLERGADEDPGAQYGHCCPDSDRFCRGGYCSGGDHL